LEEIHADLETTLGLQTLFLNPLFSVTGKTWENFLLLLVCKEATGAESGRNLFAAQSVFDVMRRVVPVILERTEQTKEDVAALLAERHEKEPRH